jgi:hypothetical protein
MLQMLNVMIDNETLDTTPSAVILSIGAVKFCKHTPDRLGEKFYAVLDIDEQKQRGRTVSADTLEWWQKQSKAARVVLDTTERRPVHEVLSELHDFIFDIDVAAGGMCVWGNGSDFDNPQIASLFQMYGFDLPWKFWNNRCFRTLKAEFKNAANGEPKRKGTHHNALDDAIHQAEYCQAIYAGLRGHVILSV